MFHLGNIKQVGQTSLRDYLVRPKYTSPPSPFANLRSLSFATSSNQYLTMTDTLASDQKMTLSFWIKRASTGSQVCLYSSISDTSNRLFFVIDSADKLNMLNRSGGTVFTMLKISTATYTSTTSWYHIVFAIDTTQATADNRARMYVNSSEVVSWSTDTNPAQNEHLFNGSGAGHFLGALLDNSNVFDGLMDEFYYIDNQQLTPASFSDGTHPIAYTGTFNTGSCYLSFENNASTTTLGHDDSAKGNNWATQNMTTGNSSTTVP